MSIYLGNLQFDQIEEKTGYRLTDDDKILWDKYHNNKADLSGMESCFHVYDIPLCIMFKGNDAAAAIMSMFTKDKLIAPKGKFEVFRYAS